MRKKLLLVRLFLVFSLVSLMPGLYSQWNIYEFNEFPAIFESNWEVIDASGDTEGILDIFSLVPDDSDASNILLQIEETGETSMSEKIAYAWNVDTARGTTIIIRTKGSSETARGERNQSFYLEIANGRIHETISGVVEEDGSTSLLFLSTGKRVSVDLSEWHIFRFNMRTDDEIKLYIDEAESSVYREECKTKSTNSFICIGDPSINGTFKQNIDYIAFAHGTHYPNDLFKPIGIVGFPYPEGDIIDSEDPTNPDYVPYPTEPIDGNWYFSEKDKNGDTIEQIITYDTTLSLDTYGARGFYARDFYPVALPAEITFYFQSTFNPDKKEVATELWGTGDYRLGVFGMPKGTPYQSVHEATLGIFEGIQFRIFPHVDSCPIRRRTYNSDGSSEPHTSTSVWLRYVDPDLCTKEDGTMHQGLQSDDCQSEDEGGNKCGWSRWGDPMENGFGMENNENIKIRIYITKHEMSIEGNGKKWTVHPGFVRFDRLSAIQLGITNKSRGLKTLKITDFKARHISSTGEPVDPPEGAMYYSPIDPSKNRWNQDTSRDLVIGYPEAENTYNLNPNPATNMLHISNTSDVEFVQIYNATGKLILTQANNKLSKIDIDMSDLQSGIYFVRISTENILTAHKFIKKE
jgi:hypothetical protein